MNNYSQTQLKQLYDENVIDNPKIYKDYFSSFFYPLTDGSHAFTENNEVTIIQNDVMQRVYLARIPKEIKIWYETSVVPRKTISLISLHDHEHFQFVVKDYDEILDARNKQIKENEAKLENMQYIIKTMSQEMRTLHKIINKQNEKLLDVNEDLKLAIKQIEQVDKYFQSLEIEETETDLHPSESDIEEDEEDDESEDFEVDSNYTEETESETDSQIDKKEMDEILDLLDDY